MKRKAIHEAIANKDRDAGYEIKSKDEGKAGDKIEAAYEKEGYLKEPFRLFHLTDQNFKPVQFHYHDFDKLIFFRQGKVTYLIEGKSYELQPGDMVIVGRNQIHGLRVDPSVPYERYVLYISHEYLETLRRQDFDPFLCFGRAAEDKEYIMRMPKFMDTEAGRYLMELERTSFAERKEEGGVFTPSGYGYSLLPELRFLELMIALGNQDPDNAGEVRPDEKDMADFNEKVIGILDYIKAHLTEEISIDGLAEHFYISKYYMMRLFKKETGFTIHKYILEKRIIMAKKYLLEDVTPTRVCELCGFQDYSTFIRAFRGSMHMTPKEFAEHSQGRTWDVVRNPQ